MTTGVLLALALALAPRAADAHGYMTKPSSRSELAYDDYVASNPEFCPHCVAAVDQYSDCDGCSSRAVWKSTSVSVPPIILH